jgi:hypothetical protein
VCIPRHHWIALVTIHRLCAWSAQNLCCGSALLHSLSKLFVTCMPCTQECFVCVGPELEEEGLDVGIVTAIAAPSTLRVEFHGDGGHAGGQLMPFRYATTCFSKQPATLFHHPVRSRITFRCMRKVFLANWLSWKEFFFLSHLMQCWLGVSRTETELV